MKDMCVVVGCHFSQKPLLNIMFSSFFENMTAMKFGLLEGILVSIRNGITNILQRGSRILAIFGRDSKL